MSRRRGIPAIRWALSATLDCCKRAVITYWRRVAAKDGCQDGLFEAAQPTNLSHLVETDCSRRIELKEFAKALSVGDRIRVLCDDGVLVAEKISPTQFKLIHSEEASKFVH